MELTQVQRRNPTGPIVAVIVLLAVVALALTSWYALLRTEPRRDAAVNPTPVTTVIACRGLAAPDALDRCEQHVQAVQSAAEAHHGH